jgi:hypothetical protein
MKGIAMFNNLPVIRSSLPALLGLGLISTIALAQVAAPPQPPGLSGPSTLSHFQCYPATGGPVAAPPVSFSTIDEFGKADIVIAEPFLVCNPTAKTHQGKTFPMVAAEAHLVCYRIIKQSPNLPKNVKYMNQFGSGVLKTGLRNIFCAPSYKKIVD